MRRLATLLAALAMTGGWMTAVTPAPAQALDLTTPICTVAGVLSKLAGTLCTVARKSGAVLSAGKKLLGGHLGGALESLSGAGTAVKAVGAGAVVAAIVVWVTGGARDALAATARVISSSTRPQLESTWFSASYWRMAGIAALLTLPFLFAAALQALMRSDLTLLARSAFGYLPLGLLAVSVAAPVATLLLSASDELSSLIAGAAGNAPGSALGKFGAYAGLLAVGSRSSFVAFFIGLLTVAATIVLWVELLIRAAAVYVVVLMLPLFFAALVWPARRVWAVRAVELLVALILSKFAIVAVLSLGAAAIGHGLLPSFAGSLAGTTLILLAAFSPWALLRLLPLHELTGSLEGLRTRGGSFPVGGADAATDRASEIAHAAMRELPAGSPVPAGAEPSAAMTAIQGLGRAQPDRAGATTSEDGSAGPGSEPGDRPGSGAGDAPVSGAGDGSESEPADVARSENGSGARTELSSPPLRSGGAPVQADGGGLTSPAPAPDQQPPMDAFWSEADGAWPTTVLGPDTMPEGPPSAASSDTPADAEPPRRDDDLRPPAQEPNGGRL
jgi:hypothetical protein